MGCPVGRSLGRDTTASRFTFPVAMSLAMVEHCPTCGSFRALILRRHPLRVHAVAAENEEQCHQYGYEDHGCNGDTCNGPRAEAMLTVRRVTIAACVVTAGTAAVAFGGHGLAWD